PPPPRPTLFPYTTLFRSEVQGFSGQSQVGLADGFILRRVGVNELRHFLGECLPIDDELGFAGLLGQAGTDAVHTDDGSVLLTDDLDQSARVEDHRLAVAAEVVLQRFDLVLAVLLRRLCGGESDGEDLRLAVGHTGNAGFQHGNRVQSGDLLGDEDALPEGAVGELEAGDDVAAGVDVADSGVEPFVGQHESAVHRDALLFEAEAFGDRATAHGHEHVLGLEGRTVLQGDLHAVGGFLDALEHHTELAAAPALLAGALEVLRDRLVLVRDQVPEAFDDGDVGSEGAPDAGELAADDTAAEDDRRAGDLVQLERLGARDDAIGDLETDGLRGRTGRQQHVRAGDGVVAVLTGDLDGVLAGELSGSEVGVDPASLDQSLQTLVVAGDDPVLVLEHLLDV